MQTIYLHNPPTSFSTSSSAVLSRSDSICPNLLFKLRISSSRSNVFCSFTLQQETTNCSKQSYKPVSLKLLKEVGCTEMKIKSYVSFENLSNYQASCVKLYKFTKMPWLKYFIYSLPKIGLTTSDRLR